MDNDKFDEVLKSLLRTPDSLKELAETIDKQGLILTKCRLIVSICINEIDLPKDNPLKGKSIRLQVSNKRFEEE